MKKGPTTTVAATKAPLPPAQGKGFHPANYVRPGVTEQEVVDIKNAFDLFDTDQGGSIDTNCNIDLIQNLRLPWSPSVLMPRTELSSK